MGDGEGTTAYVNERGELICALQMFDLGPLGLVRARPNYHRRSFLNEHPFMTVINGMDHGMGPRVANVELLGSGSHGIDYLHDRWPRISSKYDQINIDVHLAIQDGRIIQQYIPQNIDKRTTGTVDITIEFDIGLAVDAPYMKANKLKGACDVEGGVFTTGATAVAMAGGPGGCVQFFASLFEDTKPVALECRRDQMNDSASSSDSFD